jgi:FkbM family methyltransferase
VRESIPPRPNASFSVRHLLARKWHLARRLYQYDGVTVLLVEVVCQICKPGVWAYDSFRWWWYQTRGKKSVTVFGHQFAVLPKDPGISRELALYKEHEPLATRLLMQTLKPGMNVVDIGGNIGYYAMLEARLIGPTGKVVAIEPMPKNSEQLCKNVEANGYQHIQIHKVAIGDRDGTATMYISGKSNWHSMHRIPSSVGEMQVSVRTLDSFLESLDLSSVDLVRMDLEGYEVVVIHGMLRTIEKHSPRLLVELHPDLLGKQVTVEYLQSLENLGYGIEWVFEQDRDMPFRWRFISVDKPTMRELMEDSRICTEPRALTALFSCGVRRDISVRDAENRGSQPAMAGERSRKIQAAARSKLPRQVSTSSD